MYKQFETNQTEIFPDCQQYFDNIFVNRFKLS